MMRRTIARRAAPWILAAVAVLLPSLALGPAAGTAPAGLSTATAFVTVDGLGRSVRLDERHAHIALDAMWWVLGDVPAIAPVNGGPRLLATLRLNEQVLDVTIWKAPTLIVASRRLSNVSAIVFPVTGLWRHRVLVVEMGRVEASPRLVDSVSVAALDDAVRSAIGPR
ncbi:MAG TPA: hypothetical protein VJT33_07785 [bacterium]|nr:hypothetical protein [bacterium]